MSLQWVEITSEAMWACMAHAHTSETEEIMGVLLGNTHQDQNGRQYARLWMALPQAREDRRKDRVECNSNQLSYCAQIAEKFTQNTSETTRVIGWYHSHPRMIVTPSIVDVATQARYQQLDKGFVGIIISCFNENQGEKIQTVKITAFQSVLASVVQEDLPTYSDADSQTQAAIQASIQQHSEQWVQKEVQIKIVQAEEDYQRSMSDFLSIAQILKNEEQKRYENSVAAAQKRTNQTSKENLPIHVSHYAATYSQHLTRFLDSVLLAQLEAVKLKRLQTSFQLRQMQSQINEMTREKEQRLKQEEDQLPDLNFQNLSVSNQMPQNYRNYQFQNQNNYKTKQSHNLL